MKKAVRMGLSIASGVLLLCCGGSRRADGPTGTTNGYGAPGEQTVVEIPRPTSKERTTGDQEETDRAKKSKRLAQLRREYEQAEEEEAALADRLQSATAEAECARLEAEIARARKKTRAARDAYRAGGGVPTPAQSKPCAFLTDAAIEAAYERYRTNRFGPRS